MTSAVVLKDVYLTYSELGTLFNLVQEGYDLDKLCIQAQDMTCITYRAVRHNYR
jgi:hypothetical protein